MNRILLLDCTLRDGGYINNFRFGFSSICTIIERLSSAALDIIECGFLKSQANDKETSLYGSIEAIKEVINEKKKDSMYVAMIQFGAIKASEISPYDGSSIDGIRITFHEHEIDGAFVLAQDLMKKGYQIFMQPVGTATYKDSALLALIERVNQLSPFAFYLVDTLGTMYQKDLLRMFHLIDHNLNPQIFLGFHSHNNLQLSFANALELISLHTERQLIIDSSVLGLGRGAGNLCTELITRYINETFGLRYDILPLLEIIDEQIEPLKVKYRWGYDTAYYLASVTGCHPNYASYLLNKHTLRIPDINAILKELPPDKKSLFDKNLISRCYYNYMEHQILDDQVLAELRDFIGNRRVLLLAPGKSIKRYKNAISSFIEKEHPFIISIQFYPSDFPADLIFCSNLKRFHSIKEYMDSTHKQIPLLVTSNITDKNTPDCTVVNYASYLNEETSVADNAGLMCLNLLKSMDMIDIVIAGYDGFRLNQRKNYYHSSLYINVEQDKLHKMNKSIKNCLNQLMKQMKLQFLTPSVYLN